MVGTATETQYEEVATEGGGEMARLLANIADLYYKHIDDFCGGSKEEIAGQDEFVETMEDDILPRVCEVIGHAEFAPDYCGMPHDEYCVRCWKTREDLGLGA